MIPVLLRGVRTKDDKVRGMKVLLGPERALMLDDIGAAILAEVDGTSTLTEIVARLAAKFEAPPEVIHGDVDAFLVDLANKRLLEMQA